MFSEINVCTNPWKGGDFTKGAKMVCKELPVLDFHRFIDEGYPLLQQLPKWLLSKQDITKKRLWQMQWRVCSLKRNTKKRGGAKKLV